MEKATLKDLAFPHCPSKKHDKVMRRGCIEHALGKRVGVGSNKDIIPVSLEQTCAVPQPLRRAVRGWG